MVTDLLQFLFHFILIGFPASLRQVWRPGEQVFQKIKVVDYGTGLSSTDGIDQPPVVLSNAETAQCGFCRIVVQGNFTVFQKYAQIFFLVYRIGESFSCLGFWQDFILVFFYPLKICVNQGGQLQLPPVLPFFWRKPCQLIVKFIDCPNLL